MAQGLYKNTALGVSKISSSQDYMLIMSENFYIGITAGFISVPGYIAHRSFYRKYVAIIVNRMIYVYTLY